MRAFIDTSALVKRYVEEPGSRAMDDMVALVADREGDLFISNLVGLEVVGCFAKLLRKDVIDPPQYEALVRRFEFDYHDLFAIGRVTKDAERAELERAIAEPHTAISPADRLHVAEAKDAKFFQPPQPIAFVTADGALYNYARDVRKLDVWNPETEGLEAFVRIFTT